MASSDNRVPFSLRKLYSVDGAVCVVTGGASGLGFVISQTLVANGVSRLYITSRKSEQLKQAVNELSSINPGCHIEYISSDLSKKAGVDAVVSYIRGRESRIDILVNNSGATWGAPLNDFPEAKGWDNIMALNVKASFYMVAGLAELLEQGKSSTEPAHIVNVSSVAGIASDVSSGGLLAKDSGSWSYSASKAALNHLTKTLAHTLARKHIMVNAVLPGTFATRMTRHAVANNKDHLLSVQPTGRYGDDSDIAATLLFLVSKASAHVTGNLLILDGCAAL